MYMSYCRHEGTLMELRACLSDAEDHINGEAEYKVSDHEINCFRNMVETFYGFMADFGLLDEYGELDYDSLENICEAMAREYGEDMDEEDW